ncbi:hypothetical protein [Spirosoma flavum]|uniref:hypothetical protein n=1 Tax=Spirosoma flavum TaxID=2048557 RepID=UPI0036D3A2E7
MASIELGQTTFPIERTFTISLIIPNGETRATVTFPDIIGFVKKGTSTSVTPVEVGDKTVTNQIITQNYQARAPGRFRLLPFAVIINGETIRSEGAVLIVQPSATVSPPGSTTINTVEIVPGGAAFLSLRASKSSVYVGDGVSLTLAFFVADNYPYELNFQALDKQLQKITKKIRPANLWEENVPIIDLKPIPVAINGKKFREYRLFQSVFFPLSNQALRLPAVALQLGRRPVIGPPSSQPETIVFTSKPLVVAVRSWPVHPLRGRVPIGVFQLEEGLERQHIIAGKSVRYTFSISGKGNIATLPAPVILNEHTEVDVFPPEEHHSISHNGNEVTGRKTFTYFIVPHQNEVVSLVNYFQWIYFNPQTARYDTLRPHLKLQVGGKGAVAVNNTNVLSDSSVTNSETVPGAPVNKSLYAGLEAMDSTRQPISISVLIRSIANVLIVLMLLGMVFVLIKK